MWIRVLWKKCRLGTQPKGIGDMGEKSRPPVKGAGAA